MKVCLFCAFAPNFPAETHTHWTHSHVHTHEPRFAHVCSYILPQFSALILLFPGALPHFWKKGSARPRSSISYLDSLPIFRTSVFSLSFLFSLFLYVCVFYFISVSLSLCFSPRGGLRGKVFRFVLFIFFVFNFFSFFHCRRKSEKIKEECWKRMAAMLDAPCNFKSDAVLCGRSNYYFLILLKHNFYHFTENHSIPKKKFIILEFYHQQKVNYNSYIIWQFDFEYLIDHLQPIQFIQLTFYFEFISQNTSWYRPNNIYSTKIGTNRAEEEWKRSGVVKWGKVCER